MRKAKYSKVAQAGSEADAADEAPREMDFTQERWPEPGGIRLSCRQLMLSHFFAVVLVAALAFGFTYGSRESKLFEDMKDIEAQTALLRAEISEATASMRSEIKQAAASLRLLLQQAAPGAPDRLARTADRAAPAACPEVRCPAPEVVACPTVTAGVPAIPVRPSGAERAARFGIGPNRITAPYVLISKGHSGTHWIQKLIGVHPQMRVFEEIFNRSNRWKGMDFPTQDEPSRCDPDQMQKAYDKIESMKKNGKYCEEPITCPPFPLLHGTRICEFDSEVDQYLMRTDGGDERLLDAIYNQVEYEEGIIGVGFNVNTRRTTQYPGHNKNWGRALGDEFCLSYNQGDNPAKDGSCKGGQMPWTRAEELLIADPNVRVLFLTRNVLDRELSGETVWNKLTHFENGHSDKVFESLQADEANSRTPGIDLDEIHERELDAERYAFRAEEYIGDFNWWADAAGRHEKKAMWIHYDQLDDPGLVRAKMTEVCKYLGIDHRPELMRELYSEESIMRMSFTKQQLYGETQNERVHGYEQLRTSVRELDEVRNTTLRRYFK